MFLPFSTSCWISLSLSISWSNTYSVIYVYIGQILREREKYSLLELSSEIAVLQMRSARQLQPGSKVELGHDHLLLLPVISWKAGGCGYITLFTFSTRMRGLESLLYTWLESWNRPNFVVASLLLAHPPPFYLVPVLCTCALSLVGIAARAGSRAVTSRKMDQLDYRKVAVWCGPSTSRRVLHEHGRTLFWKRGLVG